MADSLYIVTLEPDSGKFLVTVGIMELLTRRIRRVGFFRPIIPLSSKENNEIAVIKKRYKLQSSYEAMYAYHYDDAMAMASQGRTKEMMEGIIAKFKALEEQCDFVLCLGLDITGLSSVFDYDINVDIARSLGCPTLSVTSGKGKSINEIVDSVRTGADTIINANCQLTALMVPRVDEDQFAEAHAKLAQTANCPVYLLPELEFIGRPTVGEIKAVIGGENVLEKRTGFNREITACKVAAMSLPNYLRHIEEGNLIITPGDRADIIFGTMAASFSAKSPHVAGLVLSGGIKLPDHILDLISGFNKFSIPILSVETDTFTTAMNINAIPGTITPENDRKFASALGWFESHVDTHELEERIINYRSTSVSPVMFEYNLFQRARKKNSCIVLPEGNDERILRAADIILRRGGISIILLGEEKSILDQAAALGLKISAAQIINPHDSPWRDKFADSYYEMRQHKGISKQMAADIIIDVNCFGTMMVYHDLAAGMVSGAQHTTQHTIMPAFQIIKTRPDTSLVSSVFLMCLDTRVLVFGDCAINPNPNSEQLAEIAISSANTAAMFDIEPKVAMLSYSTGESGKGKNVEKVRKAVSIARARRPDLKIEGPIQYDAAVDAEVAATKLPDSEVAGQATVFIFPDLNTGNNTYKAVQRAGSAVAIGPILQGLKKPVNDLSRGCLVTDIVNTVAITAIQAGPCPCKTKRQTNL